MKQYPDIEDVLIDVIELLRPDLGVDSETPSDLQARLPFVRVTLVTGRDDGRGWNPAGTSDYSVVDIDVFAESRQSAYACAQDLRSRLTAGPHRFGEVVIDWVRTEEKPRVLPWEDDNIWRFGATYRTSARR